MNKQLNMQTTIPIRAFALSTIWCLARDHAIYKSTYHNLCFFITQLTRGKLCVDVNFAPYYKGYFASQLDDELVYLSWLKQVDYNYTWGTKTPTGDVFHYKLTSAGAETLARLKSNYGDGMAIISDVAGNLVKLADLDGTIWNWAGLIYDAHNGIPSFGTEIVQDRISLSCGGLTVRINELEEAANLLNTLFLPSKSS